MREKLRNRTLKIINAKYSVAAWLWVFTSFSTAAFMLVFLIENNPGMEALLSVLPFNGFFWTISLIICSVVKAVGMAKDWPDWIGWGSFLSFCLWFFGMLSFLFIPGGPVNVVILLLPILVFNAYLFLGVILRDEDRL